MNFGGTIKLNRTGWGILLFIFLLILFIHLTRSWNGQGHGEEEQDKMVDLKALLIGAIEASQLGGKKVIAGSKGELNIKSKGKTQEGVNDPVTDADFASHCEMFNALKKAFPQINVRSEEEHTKGDTCPMGSTLKLIPPTDFPSIESLASEHVHPEDITVWIDPLDATKEYTEKFHQYVTTMVCVAVKGVPIIGVIHRPFTQQTSWGWLTKHNSPDLQVQPELQNSKENPIIIFSISHKGKVEELTKNAFGAQAQEIAAAGSGYKVLEVAHGKADLYLHDTYIKKWDICAGNAIISSMGGRMSTLHNATIDYSHDSDVVNKDGLLVAVNHHSFYYSKLEKHVPVVKN